MNLKTNTNAFAEQSGDWWIKHSLRCTTVYNIHKYGSSDFGREIDEENQNNNFKATNTSTRTGLRDLIFLIRIKSEQSSSGKKKMPNNK